MKSFAVVALAGAASAAWAPPAYGGQSSAPVDSSVPAEGYSKPAGYETSAAAPSQGYSQPSEYAPSSSVAAPGGYTKSSGAYGSPSMATHASGSSTPKAYGPTGSGPAPTGGYGGSWGSGNGTEGGYGGHGGDSYVTQVVTSYETYCPGPTTVVQNSKTYTVTEATTLTITDCPCTAVTPVQSYTPEVTTKVATSFTTVCPYATTVTFGPSTYTVESSTVLTVTDCPGGCTVTEEVPATWIVPYSTTVYASPAAPTTVTVGTQTYSVSDETTLTVEAPTSYATYTSVVEQPEKPTSYVIESSTYDVTEATTITYSVPTQQGYTMTGPIQSVYQPTGGYAPAPSTAAGPVGGQPSGYAPAPSGYAPPANGTNASPFPPEQTGNTAAKAVAGSFAFAAAVGAFFL